MLGGMSTRPEPTSLAAHDTYPLSFKMYSSISAGDNAEESAAQETLTGGFIGRGLKVFVSYSRKDLDFVEQLAPALEALGYTIIIDRKGIHGAEKWEARLGQMILEADTVVFILTPASAESEVCSWEVEQALARRKRIIPVIAKSLGTSKPHDALRDLNYVHFCPEPSVPGSGWGAGLSRLHATLSVDIEWIREHTRVAEMVARWEVENQPSDLLARGSELESLQKWREARPANAPELTTSQRFFLQASEQAETLRHDKERQQLDDMRAAQAARAQALAANEKAQEERERALQSLARRTIIGIVVAGVLSLAVGIAGLIAHRNGEAAREALAQVREEQHLQGRLINLARNREYPPPPYAVDILAKRYEGESPGHVGTDFLGGIYYGTYRIRAGTNLEAFMAFLRRYARPLFDRLDAAGGVTAASKQDPKFVEAWRALANDPESGSEFAIQQTDFVTETNYKRLSARLASGRSQQGGKTNSLARLDLAKRSEALRAVIFSIAVQYGENTRLIHDALGDFGDLSLRTDEEIITRLYQFRNKVEDYFPDIKTKSPGFVKYLKERNQWEASDALKILNQERS